MSTIINKNQIVEIIIYPQRPYYKWSGGIFSLRHKKGEEIEYYFPRFGRKKYYENDIYAEFLSIGVTYNHEEMLNRIRELHNDDLNNNFIDTGDEIYIKPYVEIRLTNNSTYYKYFDTNELCEDYKKQLLNNCDFLIEI